MIESMLYSKFNLKFNSNNSLKTREIFSLSLGNKVCTSKEIRNNVKEIIITKLSEKFKLNYITLIYKVNNKKEIMMLGREFVRINRNKCRININNKKYKFNSIKKDKNLKLKEDLFKIKLISLDNLIYLNEMFLEADSLIFQNGFLIKLLI